MRRLAHHGDSLPHEAFMIRSVLGAHVVCYEVCCRRPAWLFTLRCLFGNVCWRRASCSQVVERKAQSARGDHSSDPWFLPHSGEHEEILTKTVFPKSEVLSVNCSWQLRPGPFRQRSRLTWNFRLLYRVYQRSAPPQRSHSHLHRTSPVFVCIARYLRNTSRTRFPPPFPRYPQSRQPSRLIY